MDLYQRHISACGASTMSLPAAISSAAVNHALGFLLPLLLPDVAGDEQVARSLALEMLASQRPRTAQELRLAAQAVGLGIKGLAKLAESATPGLSSIEQDKALKWSCGLTRAGHAAERRLEEMQDQRCIGRRSEPRVDPLDAAPLPATE